MNKFLLLTLIVLFISFPGCNKEVSGPSPVPAHDRTYSQATAKPQITEKTEVPQTKCFVGDEEKKLANSNTEFGLKLFNKINKEDFGKNICISPLSLSIALDMTYNGSDKSTREAMTKVLELTGMKSDEINIASSNLINFLKSSKDDLKLTIANSIWYREDLQFSPEFENICKNYYFSEVRKGITINDVNSWCKDNTGGKIEKFLNELPSNLAVLLVNAVYFKGTWAYKFDREKTTEEYFTLLNKSKKKVPMMRQHNEFYYYRGDKFQAVSLPYRDGKISMYIFLPDSDSSLEAFQKNLDMKNWKKWMDGFHPKEGDICLPGFKIEYGTKKLNDPLISLGMEVAFKPTANFSKMCLNKDNLYISQVLHKTFIEVNEEGTEAAAATAVLMADSVSLTFSMVCNRPFFFVIRDNETGTILFMGSMVEP